MRQAIPANSIRVLAAAIALAWASSAAADRIDLRDGKQVVGKIERETPTEVTIQGSGAAQTVPLNRIASVHYHRQPAALTLAKTQEDAGNYSSAAEQFAKAASESKDKPLIHQAAVFGQARASARRALEESEGIDDAINRLEAFRSSHAETRHHFPLHELLGSLHLKKKDFVRAGQAFDELARAPWAKAKLRAGLFQGRILMAQDRLDQALARFGEVVAGKADSPEQELAQAEALLETARCYQRLKQHDREIAALEQLVERAPANATAVQGEAYAALGDAARAANRPKDALLAYLHVELLFARDKELHARALYNLTQLWSELGQADRAAAARTTLQADYANSPWTKKLGS